MSRRRVGVIGAGAMGGGIVQALARAGIAVHVRDIDPSREAVAAAHGAAIAPYPSSLARAVDVVLLVVVDATQIDAVLDGGNGLLAALPASQPVLLMSTIAPADVERFAAAIAAAGGIAIDAPMSGGPQRAADATMTVMLAGPAPAIDSLRWLFDAIAGRRFVISSRAGDGARAKLVNNLLAGIHLAGAAEAFALAGRLGLDRAQILALVSASSGASWIAGDRIPRALDDDRVVHAATALLRKDVGLANAAAVEAGVALSLGAVTARLFDRACADGLAGEDDSSLLRWMDARMSGAGPD